ncbi:MAG: methyltransferase [Candidatus Berkelbacteria bacterium Licking1014_2]|uniref:Methyltransferase n=1 Tax=Candidatus Berkelbacteria bacterium Licking1014_2 TaxID=2017146 RepID=A0A554LW62_9BACT|nr:MAG: methyltransferase [Candidatus Berkelbacteria bacterium Licking1014_2]
MRVLLVNPKNGCISSGGDFVNQPTGLMHLAGAIADEHDVMVCDCNLGEEFGVLADAFLPDIVGVSCWMGNFSHTEEILKLAKIRRLKIVAGGPFASVAPELYLELGVDCVITGEATEAFRDLLSANKHIFPEKIIYSNNRGGLLPPSYHLFRMGDYLSPAKSGLYAGRKGGVIFASIGCNHRCVFCSGGYLGKWRSRDVEIEVKFLKNNGADLIWFGDASFSFNRDHSITVADIMRKNEIEWFAEVRVDEVDINMLKLFADSGCISLWFGIESRIDAELRRMRKGLRWLDVERGIQLISDCGIRPVGFVLIGLPGQTRQSIEETVRWVEEQSFPISPNTLIPIPGTAIWNEAAKNNMVPNIVELARMVSDFYYQQSRGPIVNLSDANNGVLKEAVARINNHNQELCRG